MTEPASTSNPLDPLNLNPVEPARAVEPIVRFNPYAPDNPSPDDLIDHARCPDCRRWTLVPPLPLPLPPCLPYLKCAHCPFKILSTSYCRWLAGNPEVKHAYHPIKSKRLIRPAKPVVTAPYYRRAGVGAEIPGGKGIRRTRGREEYDPYRDVALPDSVKSKSKRSRTKHDDPAHVADIYRRVLSQFQ
jgi:hypothetical protein